MGSNGIVQPSPLLDEDDGLGQRVEDLTVQELVPQLAVDPLKNSCYIKESSNIDVKNAFTDYVFLALYIYKKELMANRTRSFYSILCC